MRPFASRKGLNYHGQVLPAKGVPFGGNEEGCSCGALGGVCIGPDHGEGRQPLQEGHYTPDEDDPFQPPQGRVNLKTSASPAMLTAGAVRKRHRPLDSSGA